VSLALVLAVASQLFQLGLWALAVGGAIAFLLAGDRLRACFHDEREALVAFVLFGALEILLLDMPGPHSSHCGMSAGAWSLQLTSAWWLPNALYSLAAVVLCARFLEPSVERAWVLPWWGCGSIALAYVVEGVTHDRIGWPWWAVHVFCQLLLLAVVGFTFRRGHRLGALVLPLFAALLPFGPWSFWHACTRLRPGDRIEDVVQKLDGYWMTRREGQSRSVHTLDLGKLSNARSITFAATGDSHADSCRVSFSEGRLVRFEMSPD
jgi:hypothetical protein